MRIKDKMRNEIEQKAALRQRLADIISGATGLDCDRDDWIPTLTEAALFIPAIAERIAGVQDKKHLTSLRSLDQYDGLDSITEFFWRNGIRA